jgi:phage portal protein BeeE
MGFLDSVLGRIGYISTKAVDTRVARWQSVYADGEKWSITDYGEAAQEIDLYEKLSWISTAVKYVAQQCAIVPLHISRRSESGLDEVIGHELISLLKHPNPLQSRFEILEGTFSYHSLCGDAYWWKNIVNGHLEEIWLLPSDRVKPVPDGNMFLKGYKFYAGPGEPLALDVDEVVHFKNFHPKTLFEGMSDFKPARMDARTDLEMAKWNAKNFGENNGRLPGVMSFKDWVEDSAWEDIKKRTEDSAKRRSIMLLRGTGDGVQWLQNTLSQKDMEFINGRQFAKEEIYNLVAPGLASVLSVNATEANSKSGKATMIDFSVWPRLTAIAEKITNDLLPMYGEGLEAWWDDIRVTDRVIGLQEQREYAKTHTIDETRKKFYGDAPLPDERGQRLPDEIGTTATQGGNDPAVGGALDQNPGQQRAQVQDIGQDVGDEPRPNTPSGKSADLAAWQRAAINRLKKGKKLEFEFETNTIPENMKGMIQRSLPNCSSMDEIKAVFEQAAKYALILEDNQVIDESIAKYLASHMSSTYRGYP